jgi:hypothetical protein
MNASKVVQKQKKAVTPSDSSVAAKNEEEKCRSKTPLKIRKGLLQG